MLRRRRALRIAREHNWAFLWQDLRKVEADMTGRGSQQDSDLLGQYLQRGRPTLGSQVVCAGGHFSPHAV